VEQGVSVVSDEPRCADDVGIVVVAKMVKYGTDRLLTMEYGLWTVMIRAPEQMC